MAKKNKIQKTTVVNIPPPLHKRLSELCDLKGYRIGAFAARSIERDVSSEEFALVQAHGYSRGKRPAKAVRA